VTVLLIGTVRKLFSGEDNSLIRYFSLFRFQRIHPPPNVFTKNEIA
jgi:hypothetical protein